MPDSPELRVALAGFGAIGDVVGRRLDRGLPGLRLAAVSARDIAKAETRLAGFARVVPVVGLGELADHAEVVVECAPAAVFREVAEPAIRARRIFMPVSVGQLLEQPDLVELAEETGARIIVPTGALLGLDAVRAAAEGAIRSVTIVTRKPPRGLVGAPYLEQHGIALEGLGAPIRVFEGSAREGARGFPANVNVAAALSLAGIGPERTRLEIWADPDLKRNVHRIVVDADSARFEMQIENVPTEDNPRTGKITALSVIAALRALTATLKVGS
ncbi:MAG TPA: aspartate dehydrogenase [Geminicoccaceae bacterium]|nr:aspartate dehydrogenase [Geminicoccaceae bacterium]